MGLDMYLEGHKYLSSSGGKKRPTCKDGHEIQSTTLDLGYWRKHPNLHGYIVNTYANGVDECQAIQLNAKELEDIADAIETNRLPHTEGFFFGTSEWHQETVKEDAQKFLDRLKDGLGAREAFDADHDAITVRPRCNHAAIMRRSRGNHAVIA